MGQVKQMTMDNAETAVDKIIFKMTDGAIDWDTAKANILKVANINMIGIDEDNVDEVMSEELK
jgi:hypothetical protein